MKTEGVRASQPARSLTIAPPLWVLENFRDTASNLPGRRDRQGMRR